MWYDNGPSTSVVIGGVYTLEEGLGRGSKGVAMNHLQKFGLTTLVSLSVLNHCGLASAQSIVAMSPRIVPPGIVAQHIVAKGYFYAPTPCELVETGGDICATVTVPLAANFSFEPISKTTKRRYTSFKGTSNRRGFFSIKVPPGRYRITVRGVSYRVFGGGRRSVDVQLEPAQSVVTIPKSGINVLQIPLVRGGAT